MATNDEKKNQTNCVNCERTIMKIDNLTCTLDSVKPILIAISSRIKMSG